MRSMFLNLMDDGSFSVLVSSGDPGEYPKVVANGVLVGDLDPPRIVATAALKRKPETSVHLRAAASHLFRAFKLQD